MSIHRIVLVLLAVVPMAGCVTVAHTPDDFELEDPWPALEMKEPVAVIGGHAPSERFSIELPAQTMTLDVGEYTEAVVDRVRAALLAQGATLRSDASRVVEIEVVYANILPGAGQFHCVVDFTVRAGNGYVRGHQARENSYDARKACNAALSRAAFECLADREIRKYLAGS